MDEEKNKGTKRKQVTKFNTVGDREQSKRDGEQFRQVRLKKQN